MSYHFQYSVQREEPIRVVSEQSTAPIHVTEVRCIPTAPIVVKETKKSRLGFVKKFFGSVFSRRPQTVRVINDDPIR